MLTIDGSFGEGGGQILRTSLAMSLICGAAVRLINLRANRDKPGLRQQHLTAVLAAAKIGSAEVEGAHVGSREIVFRPKQVVAGDYHFPIGTAGAAALVFQTVLPPLLLAPGRSTLRFEGGTHNNMAPPFDFLQKAFLPVLRKLGASVEMTLERYGFYPKGGGAFTATIEGGLPLLPIDLLARGAIVSERARAIVVRLPENIAQRELAVVGAELGFEKLDAEIVERGLSPGNVVLLEVECEHGFEVFTGFGERGKPAEKVAEQAIAEYKAWKSFEVPVGEHLADQLLIPFALAGRGAFRTVPLTLHTTTNIDVLRRFLTLEVKIEPETSGAVKISVER